MSNELVPSHADFLPTSMEHVAEVHEHLRRVAMNAASLDQMAGALEIGRAFMANDAERAWKTLEPYMRPATESEITKQMIVLIGSLVDTDKRNPQIFSRSLVLHIAAERPYAAALDAACSKIIRTQTFVPSIAEIRIAIAEMEGVINLVAQHLRAIPGYITHIEYKQQTLTQKRAAVIDAHRPAILAAISNGVPLDGFDPKIVAIVKAEQRSQP